MAIYMKWILYILFYCSTINGSNHREAPVLTIFPEHSEITFLIGYEVNIPCKATGHPEPIYTWLKNGMVLDEFGLEIQQEVGEGTIIIKKPDKHHQGVYQCMAQNDYGVAVTHNITLKKAFLDSFHNSLKPIAIHRPVVGDPLILRCTPPKSHPPALVYWGEYKNQSKHNPIKNSDRISLDLDGNLYFSSVEPEDDKGDFLYVCIAQNTVLRTLVQGDDQKIIPTPVTGTRKLIAPQLMYSSPSNDEAVKGGNKTLKCIFSGHPAPQIQWFRKGNPKSIEKGQELFLANITYEHEGVYVCQASNSKKNPDKIGHEIRLRVYGSPEWRYQPSDIQTSEDETATFDCQAHGIPKPHTEWFIDGKPLEDPPKNPRINIPSNGKLEFKNLTKSDYHVIQCLSKNDYGELFANLKLKILAEPPSFQVSPRNVTVAVGQSAMLDCKVTGAPKPRILWEKSEHYYIISDDVDVEQYTFLNNGSIVINNVTEQDEDFYFCYLENKLGTNVSSCYLTVINKTMIAKPPTNQEANASSEVSFICSADTDISMTDKLQINWLYEDDPIDFKSNKRYRTMDSNTILIISNTQVSDSGKYTCVAGNGVDEDEASAILTIKDKPGPPLSVRVSGCSNGFAEVMWSEGELNNVKLTSYIVYYNASYDFASGKQYENACETKESHRWCNIKLIPYTNYSFHVVAINELGMRSERSDFTTDLCSTPQAPPPRHPNKVCTRSQEPGTLVIEWEPMVRADHYGDNFHYKIVYKPLYYDDQEYTKEQIDTKFGPVEVLIMDWRQSEYIAKDQPIYYKYNITVEAVNKMGHASDQPKVVYGYSSQDVPISIPRNLKIIDETLKSSSVRFKWNQIAENDRHHLKGFFVGYRVIYWRQHDPKTTRHKDDILVKWLPCLVDSEKNDEDNQIDVNEEHELSVDNLWPYSKIVATVVTLNGAKASNYSDLIYFETPQGLPDKVTMLIAVERGSHHIKLSWLPPVEINGEPDGYKIEYKENAERTTPSITIITDPNQTYKKFHNLKSDTEYIFSVWALNGAGQSSEASTLMRSTTSPSVPDKPAILDIISGRDYANVSWSSFIKEQNNPGKEFSVEYRKHGDTIWQTTPEEAEHDWLNVTDLIFGTTYEFRVVAFNNNGDAMKSEIQEHVIGVDPEALKSKSAYLSWLVPVLIIFFLLILIILLLLCCWFYKRNRGANYKVYEKEQLHGVKYDEEATFDEYIRSENSTFRKSKHGSLEGSNKSTSDDDEGSDSLGAYEDVDPTKFNDDGSFVDSTKKNNDGDVDLMNFKNSLK